MDRVDVCKINGANTWEYRIYIKGVGGYAVSHIPYRSIEGVCRAAIRIGQAVGLSVFDCTNGRKEI